MNSKLLYYVGINDADYYVTRRENGKLVLCPFYRTWKSMLQRCYDSKYHSNRPTYLECSVVEEWYLFSTFKEWMEKQDWKDKQLDKDLLVPGNKVYGPDTCCFVSSRLNSLFLDCGTSRGECSLGVYKYDDKFRAMISDNGVRKHIGYFDTDEEAHNAWRLAKNSIIIDVANSQNDLIKEALLRRVEN